MIRERDDLPGGLAVPSTSRLLHGGRELEPLQPFSDGVEVGLEHPGTFANPRTLLELPSLAAEPGGVHTAQKWLDGLAWLAASVWCS